MTKCSIKFWQTYSQNLSIGLVRGTIVGISTNWNGYQIIKGYSQCWSRGLCRTRSISYQPLHEFAAFRRFSRHGSWFKMSSTISEQLFKGWKGYAFYFINIPVISGLLDYRRNWDKPDFSAHTSRYRKPCLAELRTGFLCSVRNWSILPPLDLNSIIN